MSRNTLFLLLWMQMIIDTGAVLQSRFLQPGNGIVKETWYNVVNLRLDSYLDVDTYPNCPDLVENLDELNDTPKDEDPQLKHILVRYKSFFIPREAGNYRFFIKCQEKCTFTIEKEPSVFTRLIKVNERTSTSCWNCTASQVSRTIYLDKSIRYYIEVLRIGVGKNDFAALGVEMPSGLFETPIQKSKFQRTLSMYNWHGLLAEYYTIASGTRPDLSNMTTWPTKVGCMSKTEESRQTNNFAIGATGFFIPQNSGFYRISLQCQDYCVFFLEMNGTERKIVQSNKATIGDIGTLIKGERYRMRINFYKDDEGGAIFYVKRDFSSSHAVFSSVDTRAISAESEIVPDPACTVINSTSVIMHWNETRMPIYDHFNFESYHIRFWPSDNRSQVYEHTITDRLTTSVVLSDLGVWKTYQAELFYVGKKYTLRTKLLIFRTGEGVPSVPPATVYLKKRTSTSIDITWGSVSNADRHGILTGYAIQYRKKGESVWSSILSNSIGMRKKEITGLSKYTEYGFRVAGVTSAGTGVYSPIYYEWTKEDAPTAAPVTVTAYNISSTELEISWGKVPYEERNGRIRTYIIYYKMNSTLEFSWRSKEVSSSQTISTISRLKFWSFYEISVAAKTIKEGVKSDTILARTDEDVPERPPLNVTGRVISSRSIIMNWTQIPHEYTHGKITGYTIRYKEDEGAPSQWLIHRTNQLYAIVSGLEEYFNYNLQVGGMTRKGVGAWSDNILAKTKQDVPSAPPDEIQVRNLSSYSLLISWKEVPYRHRNGIITGYMIMYREYQTSQWHELAINGMHQLEISNLTNYTYYEVRVAGVTNVGVGNFSVPSLVITEENVPSVSPGSISGKNLTSRSIIVHWSPIPMKSHRGILTGYLVRFRSATGNESTWKEMNYSRDASNGIIPNLLIFHPYYIKIAGMTRKGVGVFSKEFKVWTGEDLPYGYPMNMSWAASSSTSIYLHWKQMSREETNGILIGYKAYYQIVKCPVDRPPWCMESEIFTAKTENNGSHVTLTELKKFMEYRIWIRAFNSIGYGPPSSTVKVKTATDVPTGLPEMVEAFSKTSTSISIFWQPIRGSLRNGEIIKYRIFFRLQEKEVLKTHRVARSAPIPNNSTVEGLQSGESYKDINSSLHSTTISNLEPFRWYILRIGGINKAGLGPVAVLNASCRPSVPIGAPKLHIEDKYSLQEISLNWSKIQLFSESQGTVLEYEVQYWEDEVEMQPIISHKVMSLTTKEPQRATKLANLKPYTKYGIRVAAATQAGIGKFTKNHYGETCRCEKTVKIIKRILLPLITRNANDTFTGLVDSAIKTCCSSCTGKTTDTLWKTDANNEGILSDEEVLEKFQLGQEVYAPQLQHLHTRNRPKKRYGFGTFIPVLKSPGIAVVAKQRTAVELANEGAWVLVESLSRASPLLIISIMVLILLGYLQWINELNESDSHYDNSIKHGLPQAIWFSFVTMSALGYGDVLPSKMPIGRLLATVSMLLGVIWKVLLLSSVTVTCLVYLQDNSKALIFAEKRVAVTNQTQLFALSKRASIVKVIDYKQPFEAVKLVLSGGADLALVDSLSLINEEWVVGHPDLEIKEIIDNDQYYGITVNGKAERLGNCIDIYVRNSNEETQKIIKKPYGSIWNMTQKNGMLAKSTIISTDAKIVNKLVIALGITLSIAILSGFFYEIMHRKRRAIQVASADIIALLKKDEPLLTIADEFFGKMKQTTEKLNLKHTREIIALSKKRYAINIAPDIIDLYGDVDYDENMKRKRKSTHARLASESNFEINESSIGVHVKA